MDIPYRQHGYTLQLYRGCAIRQEVDKPKSFKEIVNWIFYAVLDRSVVVGSSYLGDAQGAKRGWATVVGGTACNRANKHKSALRSRDFRCAVTIENRGTVDVQRSALPFVQLWWC